MEKTEKNLNDSKEEKIFWTIFIISIFILVILILLNIAEIEFIIERAKNILGFWLKMFIIVFVPRRILKKSKMFRYIIIKIRKHNPLIFYYYYNLFNLVNWVYFILQFIEFYLERILKYFLVGTKIKWLSPYRKNWKKGLFKVLIIKEIYYLMQYIVLYVFKIFYEIILFFDNATIYKIIRSRILGFMMVTIGYIIIGVKFFLIYILSLIIVIYIYTFINIYIYYKKEKKYNYDILEFEKILLLFGFSNTVSFNHIYKIFTFRSKTKLLLSIIKFQKDFFFNSLKRKYGIKELTRYSLLINGTVEVTEKDLILFDDKKKETIRLSKYKFTTDFHLKKRWYRTEPYEIIIEHKFIADFYYKLDDSIPIISLENMYYNGFYNTIKLLEEYDNLLQFKFLFIKDVMDCFLLEDDFEDEQKEKKERFYKFWDKKTEEGKYYLYYLSMFYEFKELCKFIKQIEKKKEEIGYEGFKILIDDKIEYTNQMDKIVTLWGSNILSLVETEFLQMHYFIELFELLNIKYDDKEYNKILLNYTKNQDPLVYKENIFKKINDFIVKNNSEVNIDSKTKDIYEQNYKILKDLKKD